MTRAMWFAWLLRSDVRDGAAVDDIDAQRDFVAWWLLFGASEYSAAWSFDSVQVAVAMEPSKLPTGLKVPRLLRRLHSARDDLQEAFPLQNQDSVANYLCWYRMFGPAEMPCAPALGPLELQLTEAASAWGDAQDGIALPRMALAMAGALPALRERQDWHVPLLRRRLGHWYRAYGTKLLPEATAPQSCPKPALHRRRRLGVNLVGFARAESGLGEDVRRLSEALAAVQFPHCVVDVPAGRLIRQTDDSLEARLVEQPEYRITVFCMSAFDMANLFLTRGDGFFAGQYCIGHWPWELPRFPQFWQEAYGLVQEIWAPSVFVGRAYHGSSKPVFVLPPCVSVPDTLIAERRGHRSQESSPYRFIYPFDAQSTLTRKNPMALVRAFGAAFAQDDRSVSLVLRINGAPETLPGWAEIAEEVAADDRIWVLPGTFTRPDALAVMAACDCLVSPHRAEGFGRNIAEALLLGLDVLATGYSGCMDFLAPDECIAWTAQPVAPGAYPFGDGLWWAEPDLADLVSRLRAIRAQPKSPSQRAKRAKMIRQRYAPEVVGKVIAARLSALGDQAIETHESV